MLVRN
jgi:hypothetical protein